MIDYVSSPYCNFLQTGNRSIHGYLKKLCGEDSFFVKTSFEMRFCTLDLGSMTFRYAKSPKERFTEISMNEVLFVGT